MPAYGSVGQRLGKLALILSSTHTGEVAAAAAAIGKVLEAEGADWHQRAEVIEIDFRSKAQPAISPPPHGRGRGHHSPATAILEPVGSRPPSRSCTSASGSSPPQRADS